MKKLVLVVILCALAVFVVLRMVLPAAVNIFLGIGIDVPTFLVSYGNAISVGAYPTALLLTGLVILVTLVYILRKFISH